MVSHNAPIGAGIAAAIARCQAGDHAAAAEAFGTSRGEQSDDGTLRCPRGLALTGAGRVAEGLLPLTRARRQAFGNSESILVWSVTDRAT